MDKLLVYTHKATRRVKYALNLIFRDVLDVPFVVTTDKREFLDCSGPKLSYTTQALADELFFLARHLLFENGINEQNISVFDFRESKVFFATGKASVFPFDPFAAAFYLASRYEEYLPHIRDTLDRFHAKESLAFQHGFLTSPVINIWAGWIREAILEKYPDFHFPKRKYRFIPTIDIDNAYAYREKGFMRTMGGYARSVVKFNFNEVVERTQVLLGKLKDPYDTYKLQLEIQKKYGLKPIYFILLGDYGLNDKNIPAGNRKFQSLIKMLGDYAQFWIHPSFGSNSKAGQLRVEVQRLESILNREVTHSRQHFLKLNLPETYRNLIDLDITDDYTMGYASQVGFRAGICTPYHFYDLDMENETKLLIHPFAVMEGTLKQYMEVPDEEALSYIEQLIKEVKAVKGDFISLWHNESLSDQKKWQGWVHIYEEMVKMAVPE